MSTSSNPNWNFPMLGPWRSALRSLFPHGLPQRQSWTDLVAIARILEIVGRIPKSNHMFFPSNDFTLPSGGGLDIRGARIGRWPRSIQLCHWWSPYRYTVVRPTSLTFHSFDPSLSNLQTLQWAYFRLETEIDPQVRCDLLATAEWSPGQVNFEAPSTPPSSPSRRTGPWVDGPFVIFAGASTYRNCGSTYDGRHASFTDDEFRDYVETFMIHVSRATSQRQSERPARDDQSAPGSHANSDNCLPPITPV